MTNKEYVTLNSKVSEYGILQDKEKRLTYQRNIVEMGIINIITAYQKQIDFKDNHDIEQKIVNAICKVYDEEIDVLRKLQEEL